MKHISTHYHFKCLYLRIRRPTIHLCYEQPLEDETVAIRNLPELLNLNCNELLPKIELLQQMMTLQLHEWFGQFSCTLDSVAAANASKDDSKVKSEFAYSSYMHMH